MVCGVVGGGGRVVVVEEVVVVVLVVDILAKQAKPHGDECHADKRFGIKALALAFLFSGSATVDTALGVVQLD